VTDTPHEFAFPVEAGMILQFARAIGDPNPVYRDRVWARGQGFGDVIAPPTFLIVADVFDPHYSRRPAMGAEGIVEPKTLHEAWLHVGQHFAYERPVVAGEVLTVRKLPAREWVKRGRRAGALQFVEYGTEYTDSLGRRVASATWTDVQPERGHREVSVASRAEPGPDGATPCDQSGRVVARDLTRTQIVMYVGVAGDFHPLHHDDVYARALGYPGVFAPGMLTMALTARALTDELGDGALRHLDGRFTRQVWPGTTLRVHLEPARSGALAITTVDERGRAVFTGEART
jgi:acyl dehydratase